MANTGGGAGGGGSFNESASSLLERAKGASLTSLAKRGFGAWLLSIGLAAVTTTEQLLNLLIVTPIDVLTTVLTESGNAFFVEPLSVIASGADASATGAAQFELFGLPVAILIVLLSIGAVTVYLSRSDTSDLVPAGGLDVVPFVGGAEEEEDDG